MIAGAIVGVVSKVLDKIIPDPEQRAAAKLELLNANAANELGLIEMQLSAIVKEAESSDPWTSRARPAFLYVVYVFILSAIPMGFLFALQPGTAQAVTEGVKLWLTAIPEELWWLFGTGYLGYTGARSYDKRNKGGGQR